jgi:cellulose synthase/poly-beta-1,6-N-acetylglucosamine synthase-like glycosyltransferase
VTPALAVAGSLLVAVPVLCFAYAYAGYPALLWALTRGRREDNFQYGDPAAGASGDEPASGWPSISISLPAYNEAASIAGTLDGLLALDYPADRRQVVVVSDASTDGTDDIVRGYADRGVELVRLDERRGKTGAEAAAIPHLTGDIVVSTDATISIPRGSLKPLVRAFSDPTVGVASGRDVSVSSFDEESNRSESGYVGFEMWVRSLETRFGSIVGASGCFYATRRQLHRPEFPDGLSRDFASCIIARKHGFRSVSVDEAVCYVPRAASLEAEYRRKVRTMARGLSTLWYERALLNPLRYGRFAWMLTSHKLIRWLVWLTWPGALVGLTVLTLTWPSLWPVTAVVLVGLALGWIGWWMSRDGTTPALLAPAAYAVAGAVAGFSAWLRALGGRRIAFWEPTRR